MIHKIEMFTIKCNNCDKVFVDEDTGFCAWNCENGASKAAFDYGWHSDDLYTHYCPECYQFENEVICQSCGVPSISIEENRCPSCWAGDSN